jgi:hypothetical protein
VSQLKGITTDRFGGVSSCSRAGPSLVLVSLEPLQLTRRGMVMKLSIDQTVNCSGLKAGVSISKGICGCYRSKVILRQSVNSK